MDDNFNLEAHFKKLRFLILRILRSTRLKHPCKKFNGNSQLGSITVMVPSRLDSAVNLFKTLKGIGKMVQTPGNIDCIK